MSHQKRHIAPLYVDPSRLMDGVRVYTSPAGEVAVFVRRGAPFHHGEVQRARRRVDAAIRRRVGGSLLAASTRRQLAAVLGRIARPVPSYGSPLIAYEFIPTLKAEGDERGVLVPTVSLLDERVAARGRRSLELGEEWVPAVAYDVDAVLSGGVERVLIVEDPDRYALCRGSLRPRRRI